MALPHDLTIQKQDATDVTKIMNTSRQITGHQEIRVVSRLVLGRNIFVDKEKELPAHHPVPIPRALQTHLDIPVTMASHRDTLHQGQRPCTGRRHHITTGVVTLMVLVHTPI
jgi:hypothetical protein